MNSVLAFTFPYVETSEMIETVVVGGDISLYRDFTHWLVADCGIYKKLEIVE